MYYLSYLYTICSFSSHDTEHTTQIRHCPLLPHPFTCISVPSPHANIVSGCAQFLNYATSYPSCCWTKATTTLPKSTQTHKLKTIQLLLFNASHVLCVRVWVSLLISFAIVYPSRMTSKLHMYDEFAASRKYTQSGQRKSSQLFTMPRWIRMHLAEDKATIGRWLARKSSNPICDAQSERKMAKLAGYIYEDIPFAFYEWQHFGINCMHAYCENVIMQCKRQVAISILTLPIRRPYLQISLVWSHIKCAHSPAHLSAGERRAQALGESYSCARIRRSHRGK